LNSVAGVLPLAGGFHLSCSCFSRQSGIPQGIAKKAHSSRLACFEPTGPLLGQRRLSLIRARIASGFYDRPEVISKIADRLFADMFSLPVDGQVDNPWPR